MSLSLLKKLVIDGKRIAGELKEFPVLMTLSDSSLKDESIVNRIRFTLSDGQKPLAHEMISFDSEKGELSAWVRLPEVSPSKDIAVQLCLSKTDDASPVPERGVWDVDYRLVVHDAAAPKDSSVYADAMAVKQTEGGQPWLQVSHAAPLDTTDGLATVGFNGGLTDGRYVYCVPWMDGAQFPERIIGNGRVLRYDTVGEDGAFTLRYCDVGHNGGLTAALPGARFLINTVNGADYIRTQYNNVTDPTGFCRVVAG